MFALAMLLGPLAASSAQAAITFDFGPNTGSKITFVGDGSQSTFNLTPNSNPQFTVTSETGGDGSGVGTTGSIISSTGGFTFTKAGITTPFVGLQTASLSGTGTLTLQNGSETITATITGVDISTFGTGGSINTSGTINLSDLALTGTGNADLTTFYNNAVANGGSAALTFQFTPPKSLTDLTAEGTYSTSYSGSITAASVPAPPGLVLVAAALPCLGLGRWLRRRHQ
jgi:hypothetical protein